MKNIVTVTREVGPCPSCERPINMDVQVEITKTGELKSDGTVDFEGRALGTQVRHDCRKQATR